MDFKKDVPERYRCAYDKESDCFHILDTWDPQVQNIADLTLDIPKTSSALKIISSAEVNSLVGLLIKMGWMDKYKIIKAEPPHSTIKNKKRKFYPSKSQQLDEDKIVEKLIERIVNMGGVKRNLGGK
jgi:hypothetical protein